MWGASIPVAPHSFCEDAVMSKDNTRLGLVISNASVNAVDAFRCRISPPPGRSAVIDFVIAEALREGHAELVRRYIEKTGASVVRE